jgi:hypothetical protein
MDRVWAKATKPFMGRAEKGENKMNIKVNPHLLKDRTLSLRMASGRVKVINWDDKS